MKKLSSVLGVIIWPIVFMIGQFFINYLFVLFFNNKYYNNQDLYNVINTYEYQQRLNAFIDSKTLLILGITVILFLPILWIIFKKNRPSEPKCKYGIGIYILIGILVAISYNLYLNFITDYNVSDIPIYIQIIASGIIGPVLEELLFRGIVYNKLKQFNGIKRSMIISTIIFALMHFSIIDGLYTLFMGYLFVYVYEKTKNINYSVVIHMCSNISVICLGVIISWHNVIFNLILFVISLMLLVAIYLFMMMKKYTTKV